MNIYKKLETAQEEEAVVDFVAMQSRDLQDKREITVSMSLLKQGLVRDNFGPDEEYGVVTELFDHHGQAVYQSTFTQDGQIQTGVAGLKPAQFRKDAPQKGRDFAEAAGEAAKLHIQRCELVEEFADKQSHTARKKSGKKTLPYLLAAIAIIGGIYAVAWFAGGLGLNENTVVSTPISPNVANAATAATGGTTGPATAPKTESNGAQPSTQPAQGQVNTQASVSSGQPANQTNSVANPVSEAGQTTPAASEQPATAAKANAPGNTKANSPVTVKTAAQTPAADNKAGETVVKDVQANGSQADNVIIVGSDLADEIVELTRQGVGSDAKSSAGGAATTTVRNGISQVEVKEDVPLSNAANRNADSTTADKADAGSVLKTRPALDKSVDEKLSRILNAPSTPAEPSSQ